MNNGQKSTHELHVPARAELNAGSSTLRFPSCRIRIHQISLPPKPIHESHLNWSDFSNLSVPGFAHSEAWCDMRNRRSRKCEAACPVSNIHCTVPEPSEITYIVKTDTRHSAQTDDFVLRLCKWTVRWKGSQQWGCHRRMCIFVHCWTGWTECRLLCSSK